MACNGICGLYSNVPNSDNHNDSFINLCIVYISMERLYYKLGEPVDEKILRHLRRYHFIKSNHKEGKVIDFGCGSGYGSKLLSENPKTSVLAYDVSKEALKFLEENNAAPNIFIKKSKEDLKNANAVCLIDMIEHLDQETLDKELGELVKNNPSATFYISTPLNDFEGLSPTNKYHINCFTKPSYIKFLQKYFKSIDLWIIDWLYLRRMNPKEQYGSVMAVCHTKGDESDV